MYCESQRDLVSWVSGFGLVRMYPEKEVDLVRSVVSSLLVRV